MLFGASAPELIVVPWGIKSTSKSLSPYQNTVTIILRFESVFLGGFDLDRRGCVPSFHRLLLLFRGDMGYPCFTSSNNSTQHPLVPRNESKSPMKWQTSSLYVPL
ncbi:hypothetical protein TNCV_1887091 [Trichonephila clavipes]|nr:hypothetical protein TNCV_1887091 [Trichonephila clavipes]